MYKLIKNSTSVIRLEDGATIPFNPYNADYIEYHKWTLRGGIPEAADKKTKDQVWDDIRAERDKRKSRGVTVGGKWYHSDDTSRIQQLGLVLLGNNIPAGLKWKTMTGDFVTMTPTLAQQIFTAVATYDAAVFAVAETHRVNMEAAPVAEDYDYSTGWPVTYGD